MEVDVTDDQLRDNQHDLKHLPDQSRNSDKPVK